MLRSLRFERRFVRRLRGGERLHAGGLGARERLRVLRGQPRESRLVRRGQLRFARGQLLFAFAPRLRDGGLVLRSRRRDLRLVGHLDGASGRRLLGGRLRERLCVRGALVLQRRLQRRRTLLEPGARRLRSRKRCSNRLDLLRQRRPLRLDTGGALRELARAPPEIRRLRLELRDLLPRRLPLPLQRQDLVRLVGLLALQGELQIAQIDQLLVLVRQLAAEAEQLLVLLVERLPQIEELSAGDAARLGRGAGGGPHTQLVHLAPQTRHLARIRGLREHLALQPVHRRVREADLLLEPDDLPLRELEVRARALVLGLEALGLGLVALDVEVVLRGRRVVPVPVRE